MKRVPKIGQKVRRNNVSADRTTPDYPPAGAIGIVTGLNFDTVGSSPRDPFVLVRFGRRKPNGFWLEELGRNVKKKD